MNTDTRREHIMNTLQMHYDYLVSLGYNVVALFLQGSQNYNCDIYEDIYRSDIDSKAIVLPTLDDLIIGTKMVSTKYDDKYGAHIEVKDARVMVDMWKKQNMSYLELLYTDFYIINPLYKDYMQQLWDMRDEISTMHIASFLKTLSGMSREKVVALEHPYPATLLKIEKYRYDPKQLHHILRINMFIKDYFFNNKTFSDSMYVTDKLKRAYLMKAKLGGFSLEEARQLATETDNETREIKHNLIQEYCPESDFKEETFNKLKNIISDIVRYNIIEQVRKEIGGL